MSLFFTVDTKNRVSGFWEWEDVDERIAFIINGNWYGKFDNSQLTGIYRGDNPGIHNKFFEEVSEEFGETYKIRSIPDGLKVDYWDYNETILNLQAFIDLIN